MKRIFLLFIFMFFISGCSVEYNAHIEDGVVYENTFFVDEDTLENDNSFSNVATNKQTAFFDVYTANSEYYEVKKYEPGEDLLGLNYYYEFYYSDFTSSTLFSECFDQRIFSFNNDNIVLSTSNGITCMYRDDSKMFNDLEINISSSYKLIETNADIVNDGVYTWIIDSSNYSTKSILLKLDSTILNSDIEDALFDEIILYIVFGLLGIVVIFSIIFYIKYRRTI